MAGSARAGEQGPCSGDRTGFQPVIAKRFSGSAFTWAYPRILGFLVLLLASSASAHPFHETLTQFEHNAEGHSLELALRIDAIDLEQMVERWLGERINLETDPRAERSIELWLGERLSGRLPSGEKAPLSWIGHEFDGAFCWVYVQLEIPDQTEWIDLAHIVLFDWHPQPTNHIVGVGENRKQAYATTIEEPVARIQLAATEKTPRPWWWALADLAWAVWQLLQSQMSEF